MRIAALVPLALLLLPLLPQGAAEPFLSLSVTPLKPTHEDILTLRAELAPQNWTEEGRTLNITGVSGRAALQVYPRAGRNLTLAVPLASAGTANLSTALGPYEAGTILDYSVEAAVNITDAAGNTTSTRTLAGNGTVEIGGAVGVLWHFRLDEGRALAEAIGRPLLLFLFVEEQIDARSMDSETFSNTTVAALSQSFVCVRVDVSREPEAAAGYRAGTDSPAVVFLSPAGRELGRANGFVPPQVLLKKMRDTLSPPQKGGAFIPAPGLALLLLALAAAAVAGRGPFTTKLVVAVRSDLELSKGKTAVQVAHAAVECSLRAKAERPDLFRRWHSEGQRKVAVKVAGIRELEEIREKAARAGLIAVTIADAGLTEVEPGTVTCVGIGPDSEGRVDAVTGGLKLL